MNTASLPCCAGQSLIRHSPVDRDAEAAGQTLPPSTRYRSPLAEVAGHMAHAKASRCPGIPGMLERWGLYGGWCAFVCGILGLRVGALAGAGNVPPLPGGTVKDIAALGAASSVFALGEAMAAVGRLFYRGRKWYRLRREEARLAVASRPGGAAPNALVLHRHALLRGAAARRRFWRALAGAIRDAAVQLPGAAVAAAAALSHFVGGLAAALPALGVTGSGCAIAMSVAHIVTGIVHEVLAARDIERLKTCRDRYGNAASAIAAQLDGAAAQSPAELEPIRRFYHDVTNLGRARVATSLSAAHLESGRARIRIVYGIVTLLVNTAALVLAVAAVGGTLAATGGLALPIVAPLLSVGWLAYTNWRLAPRADRASPAAKSELEDWYRTAARILDDLRGNGVDAPHQSAQCAAALLRELGIDAALIEALKAMQPDADAAALKLVLSYLDGKAAAPEAQSAHQVTAAGSGSPAHG